MSKSAEDWRRFGQSNRARETTRRFARRGEPRQQSKAKPEPGPDGEPAKRSRRIRRWSLLNCRLSRSGGTTSRSSDRDRWTEIDLAWVAPELELGDDRRLVLDAPDPFPEYKWAVHRGELRFPSEDCNGNPAWFRSQNHATAGTYARITRFFRGGWEGRPFPRGKTSTLRPDSGDSCPRWPQTPPTSPKPPPDPEPSAGREPRR